MFRRFDIDLSPFVDNDIYLRTLRVEGRFSREEALKRLNNAGVAPSDIMGMYREGENSPWSAVLHTREQAANVNSPQIKYVAKLIVDLRVHWLPLYITDDIIREVLSPFGHVIDITKDTTILDQANSTLNGTRLVKLQTTEFDSMQIPHIVSLGSCGMLITMKGRPPICLKCRQSGHLRKDCQEKATTYASVANSRRVHQPQTTVPPTPAPPVPQVLVSTQSVPQEPTTETEQIATSTPELTTEEIEIITRDEVNISPKDTTEHRTELFDTDTLTWEKVKTCKRSRRSSTEDDNRMDTSVIKI
ncbi:hypothetical protein ACJMK2_032976 [Sinanodonta woodiana]|uniref:CCHC-type domain-containing protein n=1 Tax=Sinanodonta woodiana TaxID=1069815 RepID=A0ABD3X3F3_SINWO